VVHRLGLAPSRERARALIMAGRVRVDGRRVDKPGTPVPAAARVEVLEPEHPYVGRGGHKLAGALDALGVEVAGKVALDLGSSTGGFTDCLLRHGAVRVHAVDVGRGLIDAGLRADPRVILHEGVNARYLTLADLGEPVDRITADLAFISLRLVLAALPPLLVAGGEALLLVKPQFELGRGEVGRGVVHDPERHARAIVLVAEEAARQGFRRLGVVASPLRGARGNREFFLWLGRGGADLGEELAARVAAAVAP
jgi:23S rRNA (cytidine1920-2'-O)/16S rRNA (cytidine1409-2'-O)-methyltransferase